MPDDSGRTVGRVSLKAMPDLSSFRRDLTEGLNEAVRGLNVQIPVLADTARFKADIDTAVAEASRKAVTVDVDADTTGLDAHLDEATRDRTAEIDADAETAAASAQLDRAARDRTSHINLSAAIPDAGALLKWTTLLSGLPSLAVAATGSILSLAGSLAQLAGTAAAAPGALAGLGAVIGTIVTATDGMGAAMKRNTSSVAALGTSAAQAKIQQLQLASAQEAVAVAEQQAADSRVQAAKNVKDAQDALTQSRQSAVQDEESASQRIQQASQSLAAAQRNEMSAQQALTQAREDAAKALRDMSDNLSDAQLSERQAEISLQRAKENLDQTNTNASASLLDKQQAQLSYDQAVQSLKEAKERVSDLKDEKSKADAAGIAGSAQVKAAQQGVTDAQNATKKANDDLTAAEQERNAKAIADAKAIKKAEQGVADARAAQVKAQQDGARQIADAQRSLLEMQLQQQAAAERNAATLSKQDAAMSKLAPNAQAAAKAMLAFGDAFEPVKKAVQQNFWKGFAGGFEDLQKTVLPQLQAGMPKLAGALGDNLKEVTGGLKDSLSGGVLDDFFDQISKGAEKGKGAIRPLIDAFTTLTSFGAKQAGSAGSWIANLAKEFNDFIEGASKSGKLQVWFDNAKTGFHDLGQVIKNAAGIVGGFVRAASAGSGSTLGTLADTLGKVKAVVTSPGFQKALTGIFSAAKDGARAIAGALPAVGKGIEALSGPLQTFLRVGGKVFAALLTQASKVATVLAPIFTPIIKTVGNLVQSALPSIGKAFEAVGKAIGPVVAALAPIVKDLFPKLSSAIQSAAPGLAQFATGAVAVAARFLGDLADAFTWLTKHVPLFVPILAGLVVGFKLFNAALDTGPIGLIITAIGALVVAVTEVVKHWKTIWAKIHDYIINPVKTALNWVVARWNDVKDFFVGLWNSIKHTAAAAWDWVSSIPGWIWNKLSQITDTITGYGKRLIGWIWDGIKTAAGNVWAWFGNIGTKIWDAVKTLGSDIADIGSTIWGWLTSTVSIVWDWITDLPGNLWDAVKGLAGAIGSIASSIWGWIVDKASVVWTWVTDLPGKLWDLVKSIAGQLADIGSAIFNGIVDGMKSAVTENPVSGSAFDPTINGGGGLLGGLLHPHAIGGTLDEGLNVIDEQGPEILDKRGSSVRVITAQLSAPILQSLSRSSQHQTQVGPFYVNNPIAEPMSVTINKTLALEAAIRSNR